MISRDGFLPSFEPASVRFMFSSFPRSLMRYALISLFLFVPCLSLPRSVHSPVLPFFPSLPHLGSPVLALVISSPRSLNRSIHFVAF